MKTKKPYFFLLGGHDLEMLTIRELLEQNQYVQEKDYLDRHLGWGAKLSDYADSFKKDKVNVAIELLEDTPQPPQYLRIDHHNELNTLPASIEQVAALLNTPLSRHQQLVAANDKGFIPALQDFGASATEIADIRRRDRAAQGVTDEDEHLAELSIQNSKEIVNGITVVKSLTPRFSTVADGLFGRYKNLIVYNDTELTCYCTDKLIINNELKNLLKKEKISYGLSYFSIFSINISNHILNEIISSFLNQKE